MVPFRWTAWSGLALTTTFLAAGASRAELTYEKDVRPILKAYCFHCHGEGSTTRGGLDLRMRRLILAGGDSGPVLVPGQASASPLVERVRLGEMPPGKSAKKPSAEELAILTRWVNGGAPTARPEPTSVSPEDYMTEEERSFWAFQPIRRPAVPRARHQERVRTPIDAFVLARLEEKGLSLAPDADRRTFIRRASFDLLGLPPTPEEVEQFLQDTAPDAHERLIDRLLASPHYGERWGRHWLDVAGYADSEGYTDEDRVRPHAWRYRDYVIRAFNEDRPLDRFIQEQIAGDEMVAATSQGTTPEEIDCLTATGFLRMAPDGTASAGLDQALARNDVMARTLEIFSTALLGLTVGCAQCHDHRYDPISHVDYYRLRAIFEPALSPTTWRTPPRRLVSLYSKADRARAAAIEQAARKIDAQRLKRQEELIARVFERELAKLSEDLQAEARQARDTPPPRRTKAQKAILKRYPSLNVSAGSLRLYDREAGQELAALSARAAEVRATRPPEGFVRALTEPAGQAPPPTHLFHRGEHEQPRQQVEPGELRVLGSGRGVSIPVDDPDLPTSGRRLAYARWLTSSDHPLVARVLVNQVWQHHLGRGIVATPGDFGLLGARPSHPELLDWLACELREKGWSLKRLHRLIMTSTVYRQSSQRDPRAEQLDADNELLSRMPLRRLEAEVIRDTMLAVSGQLNRKPFGPPVPVMADAVGQFILGIENLNAGRPGAVIPLGGEEHRRSIYAQVRRSRPLSMLEAFDAPTLEPNCTSRASSTVAPQALLLMNNEQVLEQARHLADRVKQEAGPGPEAQVRRLWLLVYGREVTPEELADALGLLREQSALLARTPGKDITPEHEALTLLCHALLGSNELLYVG